MKKHTQIFYYFVLIAILGFTPVYGYKTPAENWVLNAQLNPLDRILVDAAEAYGHLAENFAELGLINEASASNHKVIEILNSFHDNAPIIKQFFRQAMAYSSSGNHREALKNYYTAYRITVRSGERIEMQSKCLIAIANVYEKQGHTSLANALKLQAETLIQQP